jgi:nitroreductase/FMN reductase [NAD(P)H]
MVREHPDMCILLTDCNHGERLFFGVRRGVSTGNAPALWHNPVFPLRQTLDCFMTDIATRITHALDARFGVDLPLPADCAEPGALGRMLEHRSHRRYAARPVGADLLGLLFACAMSAPSKSDLQQADIVHVRDAALQKQIAALVPDSPWIASAPVLLVFCGNNRRTRQVAQWRGKTFANDHLDAFMNAAVDAGIVLMNFINAAEAAGLGCCAISSVRNHAQSVSDLLGLPDWVFPLAGMCVGYPESAGVITPRLPLDVTVHTDRFGEEGIEAKIDGYDRRRAALVPYKKQRDPKQFGEAAFYGWSEDKARQYAKPQRADFGEFIRRKRFNLD